MKDVKIETIEMDISEIAEYKSNPRTISKKDFAILKKSLKDFPSMLDVREIVVDENGVILGGNQRYKALQALGKTKVKVKKVTGWSDEKIRVILCTDDPVSSVFLQHDPHRCKRGRKYDKLFPARTT